MPILWRPQMSLGNALLDGDHRYLISLINTVELALRANGARDALTTALDQLVLYTHDHFDREEKLMRAIRYPAYDEHRRSHRDLAARLVEIRAAIEAAPANAAPEHEVDRLIELLRSWLLDHVLKEDLLLKPVLAGYPENFAG
jgi:hemerythrin